MRDLITIIRDNARATLRAAKVAEDSGQDTLAGVLRLEVTKACGAAGIPVPSLDAAPVTTDADKSAAKVPFFRGHELPSALEAQ